MANVGKLAQEILEKFDDDIARLLASGKAEEAAAKKLERARVYKGLAKEAEEMPSSFSREAAEPKTLQEAIQNSDTIKPTLATGDSPETFSKNYPDPFESDFSVGGKTKKDLSQFNAELDPTGGRSVSSPVETPTPLNDSTSPMSLMDRLKANKGKLAVGAGAAGLGGYALMQPEGPEQAPGAAMKVSETEPGAAPPASRGGLSASASTSVRGNEIPKRMFGNPGSVDSLLGKLSKVKAEPVDGSFAADIAGADRDKAGAGLKREEGRDAIEKGQFFDILGRSLTQIGAAAQGLQSNVDLSNIAQKSSVDWESRRKELQDDYDRRIAEADKRVANATRGQEKAEAKAEGNALERRKIMTEDYFDKWKAYRDEILQTQRLASEYQKAVDTKGRTAAGASLKDIEKKLGKEEQRQTQRRLFDTQVDALKAAQGTDKWDEELQKTKAAFMKLNTDIEEADAKFAPKIPNGFWENMTGEASLPDLDAIKKYNRGQLQLGDTLVKQYQNVLGSGTLEGEIPAEGTARPSANSTVEKAPSKIAMRHIATGKVKEYDSNDPKLKAILANPAFERETK